MKYTEYIAIVELPDDAEEWGDGIWIIDGEGGIRYREDNAWMHYKDIEEIKLRPMPDNFGLEGKWEIDELIQKAMGEDSYVCSFCQTIWKSSNIKNMHYCPTCGALMKY